MLVSTFLYHQMDEIHRFQLIDMAAGQPLVKDFKMMPFMFTREVSYCLLSGFKQVIEQTES